MSPISIEWIPFLRKIFFFSTFSEEELSRLLEQMRLLSLPKGAVLYRQGDPGDALYIVYSGRLRLTQSDEGQEQTLAYLGRGEHLGEMSLLTGQTRPNEATADSTVELLVLYKKDFDPLLREIPTMAVHISRVLSHRLLETTKAKAGGPPTSKIFSLISPLPMEDKVVFSVSLALALVEQTHKKVLLLEVAEREGGVIGKALGLAPVPVDDESLRQDDLQTPETLERLTVFHPSGLELITLPLALLEGRLYNALYPFLSLLRKNYDYTLLAMPPRMTRSVRAVMEESDKILFVDKDSAAPGSAEIMEQVTGVIFAKKLFWIQLLEKSVAAAGNAHFSLPWPGAGKGNSPFLPEEATASRRAMGRLARQFGKLRVGLALGSGAAFGYVIIGMLRVLEKHGIYPDILAGTSMGALVGSFYASGKSPDEMEQIALSITKRKLLSLADITLPWQGLILGRQVLGFLKSILGEATFDQMQIPFACVATDIMTGEEVTLQQGKVAEAVRASISLPFYFQPYFTQGRFLVDGGLVNPVPTSTIAAMGADILISVNLTTKPTNRRFLRHRDRRRQSSAYWKGPNILEVIMKTIYTMQFGIAQTRSEIAHLVLSPDLSQYTWADFHRSAEIIKIGEASMEEAIPKVKSHLPCFSDYCKVPPRPQTIYKPY